ncbi:MAG: cyclic pyranopterin monophosphate synthase MoaC [Planctomycetota bacterium]|nr:MAG: cyclic pyranopterin monophosphate synthase MoaC [Planctomycetota bacterium]
MTRPIDDDAETAAQPDAPEESHGPALSHVTGGSRGPESRMVDVSGKPTTPRRALARAVVRFPAGRLAGLLAGGGPKGPIEEVARAAGILAAKRTGELIPMCHPLGLDHVEITFRDLGSDRLEVRCGASCTGRTGVEMESMVGAAVAALTVYDMTKALDKGIRIEAVELLEKSGGKSGTWRAPDCAGPA